MITHDVPTSAATEAQATPDPPAAAPEGSAAPAPAADPQPAALSASWAELDRRDRDLIARERQVKGAAEQAVSEYKAKLASMKRAELLREIGADPLEATLEILGELPETPAPPPDPAAEWRQRYQDLEGKYLSLEEKIELREVDRDIQQALATSKLPLVSLMRQSNPQMAAIVNAQIKEETKRYGQRPDLGDLLTRVEASVGEMYRQALDRLLEIDDLRAHASQRLSATPLATSTATAPRPSGILQAGLSNAASAEPDTRPAASLSRVERKRLALEAFTARQRADASST